MLDLYTAYQTWPGDIRGKLSLHDLRRMSDGGLKRIAKERARQISEEGFDAAHDDERTGFQLAEAASSYIAACNSPGLAEELWPFTDGFTPSEDPIRNLERAGALIAAEIDRLLRLRNSRGAA